MFDFVRRNNKVLLFILFLLIIPSFVLFGLEGYTRMNDKGEVIARVDGREIRQGEWDNAHKQEADRLREQIPNLDPKLLDAPEARFGTLERLVSDRVIAAAAQHSRFITSDEALARELQRIPAIASLRGPDGKLDVARYKQLVAQQGLTPEGFEAQVRADLSARRVLAGVGGTGLLTQAPARLALDAFLERREIQVARFDAPALAAKIQPTDAEIEAYYQANPQLFQAPERVDIEYVVLDLATIQKGVSVNEADLRAYYEQNTARLAGREERRASHILIAAAKTAPADQREAARKKAEDLLAQVRANPASFADLARKHSQDPGSAAKGGDLDFFARGAMVKPFEDAAFALKKGDTSGLVESDFGFHIIRLTDIKTPTVKTFEQMRPELEAQLRQQQAQRKFAESADGFSNAVYEQADSLKGVADRYRLDVRTAIGVQRQPAAGLSGPVAHPKFLSALFGADSLEKKRNTEAIEVGPSQLAAGRVVRHQPARTLPLAEVKDKVRERLKVQRGIEQARQAGETQLAAWKAAPATASLPAAVTVSRDQPAGQPGPIIEAALRADPTALPAFVGVDLGPAGYAVIKVVQSIARPAPDEARARAERQQHAQWWTQAETLAYFNLLKARFKTEIKVPQPTAAAPSPAAAN
jgi:peptidyl-prolyl cis-trans isomerase D